MENLTIKTLMEGLAIAQELAERAKSRGDQNGAQRLYARAIKIRAQIAHLVIEQTEKEENA